MAIAMGITIGAWIAAAFLSALRGKPQLIEYALGASVGSILTAFLSVL